MTPLRNEVFAVDLSVDWSIALVRTASVCLERDHTSSDIVRRVLGADAASWTMPLHWMSRLLVDTDEGVKSGACQSQLVER